MVVVFTGCLLTGNNLVAQQPGASTESDLAALYSRGMSEFQNGDYARAASDLEALVAKAEFAPTSSCHQHRGPFAKSGPVWKAEQPKSPQ